MNDRSRGLSRRRSEGLEAAANPGDRGQMVSQGCVRVFNEDMLDLKRVPLGTPVVIKT